jgi:antitoxin (DNA-binding transcriptional repressor) of toxin-antitoxin stability system
MTVTVDEAKKSLPRLLRQVERGGEVIICRGKLPVAKIVPTGKSRGPRPPVGQCTSPRFDIPENVFAPLEDGELEMWS